MPLFCPRTLHSNHPCIASKQRSPMWNCMTTASHNPTSTMLTVTQKPLLFYKRNVISRKSITRCRACSFVSAYSLGTLTPEHVTERPVRGQHKPGSQRLRLVLENASPRSDTRMVARDLTFGRDHSLWPPVEWRQHSVTFARLWIIFCKSWLPLVCFQGTAVGVCSWVNYLLSPVF